MQLFSVGIPVSATCVKDSVATISVCCSLDRHTILIDRTAASFPCHHSHSVDILSVMNRCQYCRIIHRTIQHCIWHLSRRCTTTMSTVDIMPPHVRALCGQEVGWVIRLCGAEEPCLLVCRRQVHCQHRQNKCLVYTELGVECQALVVQYPF